MPIIAGQQITRRWKWEVFGSPEDLDDYLTLHPNVRVIDAKLMDDEGIVTCDVFLEIDESKKV
jgi:hypothetical protein